MYIRKPLPSRESLTEAFLCRKKVELADETGHIYVMEILVLNELADLVTFFGKAEEKHVSGYVDYRNGIGGIAAEI